MKATKCAAEEPKYYHTSSYDIYISQSQVKDAGLGVYTRDFIPKDTVIDEYYGELYNIGFSPSRYFVEIMPNWGVDAFNYPRCYMAMMNDTFGTNITTNCEFDIDIEAKRVFIKTLIDVQPHSELFVSYGEDYWKTY